MIHGFSKVAAAVPELAVASPQYNAASISALIDRACHEHCGVLVFPELCITSATAGDLFFTDSLLDEAEAALSSIAAHTKGKPVLVFVGCPVRQCNRLYDCAVAILDGALLGVVPRTHFAPDDGWGGSRWFSPAPSAAKTIPLCGSRVPFGTDLLFTCDSMRELVVACELGRDGWAPVSPAVRHTEAGATVIAHLSATEELVGRDGYRRCMAESNSGRLLCTYITAETGESESTTDFVFGGHCLVASNGVVVGENPPFGGKELTTAVVDLAHLCHDRMEHKHGCPTEEDAHTAVPFTLPMAEIDLDGVISPTPFLPNDGEAQEKGCGQMLEIQARGLAGRIRAAHATGCVIGLSGGLDSTLALIVTVRAVELCGLPRTAITSVTMPCFGTTSRTRSNAEALAVAFGTSFRCVDIKEAVDLHFRDIDHDPTALTVVYENAQARERTQILMDIANGSGALVIGTGDLSELALGWATYNGDHMSNYGVNSGVPKTLVRHLVAFCATAFDTAGASELAAVLRDVLATPVSPELLPATENGEIAQRTEDLVGPYDLHDFFLYHFVRYGESPEKMRREAAAAFGDRFSQAVIDRWLHTFLRRFYTQQFKRSALPDGPKLGTVGLSPRHAWCMPSDAAPPKG